MSEMKIDWLEYHNKKHILAWFVLEAVGELGKEKFRGCDPSSLDVSLTINGETVSLMKHMDNLNSQLEHIENNGYRLGYKQATSDALNKLYDLECEI